MQLILLINSGEIESTYHPHEYGAKRKEGIAMKKFKRIMATVLSLCMVMAGSLTAFAAELPEQSLEKSGLVEGITRATGVLAVFVDKDCDVIGNGVRLRREPDENGEVLGLLYEKDGACVHTSGVYYSTDDQTWLEVTSSSIGQSGWIALPYVRVRK